MRGYIFLFFTVLFCYGQVEQLWGQRSSAELSTSLNGRVVSSDDQSALEMATIVIGKNEIWTTSDDKGRFFIQSIKPGRYSYEVSYLGFSKATGSIEIKAGKNQLMITLEPLGLGLKEVIVTAVEQKMGSSSRIDQAAIQHLQPKSVEDLLQLLPGSVTKNPQINSAAQASLREIGTDKNNSMGVSVIVDGAPLSNDANMQTMSTSKSGTSYSSQTTAGGGIDLRSISPDNIESLEVIRGIPSVEYGNLTSGAIVIKTKSGATPLEAKFKSDPNSKMFYVGKGMTLGKAGAINLSADYTQSYTDIRKRYEGFERITANVGYSTTFLKDSKPLTLNLKAALFSNINNSKSDPQLKLDERINNEYIGMRFNIEGMWNLNTPWLTNLGYSLSAQYSVQNDFRRQQVILTSGLTPIGYWRESGEYETIFLNSSYYSDSRIDGKPLDLFGQLRGSKMFQFSDNFFTTIKAGVEWRFNKNYGEGLLFDYQAPPQVFENQTVRPRAFNSIPAMNTLSAYLEDKIMLPIGSTSLTVQGGVRANSLFVEQNGTDRSIFTIEPRLNAEYQFLNADNNSVFDDLSVVGGYGIASKIPTMIYLFPDKAYFDETSLAALYDGASKSIAVMTTKVVHDTSNPHLRPSQTEKIEIGVAGRIHKRRGSISFFTEKHKDEFAYRQMPTTMAYNSYSLPAGITGAYYSNGNVIYTKDGQDHTTTAVQDTSLYSYGVPENNGLTIKRGVEYSFDLGQLPLIRTSLIIDGAWLSIKRTSTLPSYKKITNSYAGQRYPYLAIMPGGNGSINQRINTNFRFITHLPQLKMIISSTLQVIWMESYQQIYKDESGKDRFYLDHNLNGTDGDVKYYYINPIGFYDKEGTTHRWMPEHQDQYKYQLMRQEYAHTNIFGKEIYPPVVVANFRLTKELSKHINFSFTANNFLKLYKSHKKNTATGYADLTLPLYFGAEITIKL